MLTYLCRISKRLDQIVHLLRDLNCKSDEILVRLDTMDKCLARLKVDHE